MTQLRVEVTNGSEAYYGAIQQVCDLRFGDGYLTRKTYERWMKCPPLLKTALIGGEFAGFAVMLPASTEEIMRHMDMPRADVLGIAGNRPALIYQSAAVEPKYEHCGVMSAMARAGLKQARELGYGALFASAWVYQGQIPIAGTFRAFDFQPL